ncbi:MAG: HEAT repeat domain-containing protein, partial [archaeon]|nr:HEAT repeat domain-containing protein [archaeon]
MATWHDSTEVQNPYSLAVQFNGLMESFSRSFRPKLVMQTVFATASEFALHPDWQIRCACYDSIVICGETFLPIAKQFLPRLPAILDKCSKDPHPRVRYCASSIVGQLSLDFEETLTKAYAPVCLNLLVELLKDPDVTARSQAALALINWCEVAHRKETDPFLPALIPLILGLLQSGEAPCEIAGLKAVFSLANFMLADFQQYYAAVDTHLKALWNSRTEPHQQAVRSECLTTISLVGMNAGKERFGADALALCKFLEATKIAKDDPLYKQVPLIYCRLSYVLQEDFVAFLPAALASIFAELEDETSCCKVVHDYTG